MSRRGCEQKGKPWLLRSTIAKTHSFHFNHRKSPLHDLSFTHTPLLSLSSQNELFFLRATSTSQISTNKPSHSFLLLSLSHTPTQTHSSLPHSYLSIIAPSLSLTHKNTFESSLTLFLWCNLTLKFKLRRINKYAHVGILSLFYAPSLSISHSHT